jgi:hypothetical protein
MDQHAEVFHTVLSVVVFDEEGAKRVKTRRCKEGEFNSPPYPNMGIRRRLYNGQV